ncbi:DUF362 domain-containing protein [Bacteroidota bacterium]
MIIVNQQRCVGCGQCVPFCPCQALKAWGTAEVIRANCTDCLDCLDYCPVEALEVENGAG